MSDNTETVEGYVIDGGCIRKNPRDDLLEKARTHTRECALMGHCIESGYGVVTDDDRLVFLDASATPKVVDTIEQSEREEGHRVRVIRDKEEGEMQTTTVEEVE